MASATIGQPATLIVHRDAHAFRYKAIEQLQWVRVKCSLLLRRISRTENPSLCHALAGLSANAFSLIAMLEKPAIAPIYQVILNACEATRAKYLNCEAQLQRMNLDGFTTTWRIACELSLAWMESGKAARQWLIYLDAARNDRQTALSVQSQAYTAQHMQPPFVPINMGSLPVPIMAASRSSLPQSSHYNSVPQSHHSGLGPDSLRYSATGGTQQYPMRNARSQYTHHYAANHSAVTSDSHARPRTMDRVSQPGYRARRFATAGRAGTQAHETSFFKPTYETSQQRGSLQPTPSLVPVSSFVPPFLSMPYSPNAQNADWTSLNISASNRVPVDGIYGSLPRVIEDDDVNYPLDLNDTLTFESFLALSGRNSATDP
ncbi:hypothetical protein QFC24_006301 [Naganishia onofrii]|uniref:Uncharacterized protein n=1 Tax=Naganishia onofrii TaxID=1851511 RepID=A0ACC2X1V7_9TREE|nr:hypothetical protein QFC24_006301 [Naganishia onofrii]